MPTHKPHPFEERLQRLEDALEQKMDKTDGENLEEDLGERLSDLEDKHQELGQEVENLEAQVSDAKSRIENLESEDR
jgi:predicted  nucleic acid-binding Zn-ribbon protein